LWSINRESGAIAKKSRKEIPGEFHAMMRGRRSAAWMAIMARTIAPISFSQTWIFFESARHDGNAPIIGPRIHACASDIS
jgi:hypothetical protein